MLLLAALPMAIVGCGGGEESGGDGEEAAAVQPQGTPVVVSLPNMTWGACAASVRGDLAKVDGIDHDNIVCDTDNLTCKIYVDDEFDAQATFDKLAQSNPHIEDFSIKN